MNNEASRGTPADVTITARCYRTGDPLRITVIKGTIAQVEPMLVPGEQPLPFVGPGLTDLQINGYAGIDFNDCPPSPERVAQAAELLFREGVTAFFPTVITNGEEEIGQMLQAVSEACRRYPDSTSSIAGIHLEGPFLSPEDGPRGAHSRDAIRPPDWELFKRWQQLADGRIKIVTLSPEWPEACDFIVRLVQSGVTASIGHTAATPEQISAAVRSGATMSTHLGNGAHLQLPRHPNYLWQQLAEDDLWSGLIPDGHHLPEAFLKVAMKVKGARAILVSDAVYLSGMPAGEYRTHIGGEVVLRPDGKLHLKANPNLLAGSAQMLKTGIEHLFRNGLASFADAWDMASIGPANAMGLPGRSGIVPGAPADIVLFGRKADRIEIRQTYKAGRIVYQSNDE